MISVPLLASRPQIEALVTLPDVGLLVMTVNGVIWDGTERPFHNGDVLQLRSTWHRLGSLPIHALDERLQGIAAAQCHCDGPVGVRDLCDAPRRRDPKIRQHFAEWLESFHAAPDPSHEFNNFYLVVHGGPLLRVSVGTRLPPARADVQAFYDEHFGVAFGPRTVEDTRFAWNDTCVYVARTAAYPSQLWLRLGGPRLDCIQLESSQDFSQIPAPPDYVWFPSESRGNIGIAFLQPIQHAGDRPSTQNLYDLPVRPPDAPPEPGSPITDGSLPPESHTMRSIFGTSSEGFQGYFAGLASPSGSQGTNPASALGGFDSSSSGSSSSSTSAEAGISLLQQRTHIRRLVMSNTSPAGAPLIGHAATRDGTSDAEEDMRLQVWQPGLPPILLSLPRQCRTFEVDQALAAQGVRLKATDLVPAFPPAANLLQCVPRLQTGHVILIHADSSHNPLMAVAVHEQDTARVICERLHCPARSLVLDGHLWHGFHSGCYTGMRVHLAPTEDAIAKPSSWPTRQVSTPQVASVLRVATPCRQRTLAAQSGARALTTEQAKGAPDATRQTICLSDAIPVSTCGHTSPATMHASVDDLLHCLEPFRLEALHLPAESLAHMHVVAQDWLSAMPQATCTSAWDSVDLYTDGSFCPESGHSGWAVLAVGHINQRQVCLGAFADVADTCSLVEGPMDAHIAELIAMFHALTIVAASAHGSYRIIGDCTSALDIAQASAASRSQCSLAGAILDLHLVAKHRGACLTFDHIHSHQGNAGNEAVDSLAKAAAKRLYCIPAPSDALQGLAREGKLGWMWWPVSGLSHHSIVPGLQDSGQALPDQHFPLPCRHNCHAIPGVPQQLSVQSTTCSQNAEWRLCLATYNANSLCKEAERQNLDNMLHRHHVHIAGLQESRHFRGTKTSTQHYTCFASQSVRGNLGCQIWIAKAMPAAKGPDGLDITFQTAMATISYSTPRILMVNVPAGKSLFTIVCAHAPISAATPEEHTEWWSELNNALRRVPRRAVPILLIDANARYTVPSIHTNLAGAKADNANAASLRRVAEDHELHSAGFFDHQGRRIATWRSPHGKEAQLDYVLVPTSTSEHVTLHGQPWLPPHEPFVDHRALLAELAWRQPTDSPSARAPMLDRQKMRTPEGRYILQHMFRTAPAVPWAYHVEDHLQLINDHIYGTLQVHFTALASRPRQPHISDVQWAEIRARRHSRRLMMRVKRQRDRGAIAAILQAWKHQTRDTQRPADVARAQNQLHRSCLHEARLARVIAALNRTVSKAALKDAAAHTRAVLRDAEVQGPAELYGALRGVMKVGRRYKTPQALPSLVLEGRVLADPQEVRDALTAHFAEPEHGHRAAIPDVVASGCLTGGRMVDLLQLPSPSDVIQGWLSLKDNKATGMSGIPAEVYRYAALDAADCHAPLLLKISMRGCWPTLWRGTLNVAIPKPNKDGSKLASWRSIALAEAAYKGVGRAMRKKLAHGLRRLASPGQHGSLPGEQIGAPSHHVLAHVQLALSRGTSTAVVFLDGRSAYYATIREYLLNHDRDDPTSLQDLITLLVPDESLHDSIVAALLGPGLLQQGGLHPSLEDFLRSNMQASWFALDTRHMFNRHAQALGLAPHSLTFFSSSCKPAS